LTITVILVIYPPQFRLIGELEDEGRENRLSASRASCSSATRSGACDCAKLHWQIALDVLYKIELQTATIRRGRGEEEALKSPDVIELFPATACSAWQDAL
jgi:molybdopterin converting factor small subunit